MKISKSFFRICIITGFILFAQYSFATDTQTVPIPKDDVPPPTKTKPLSFQFITASATINDLELAVYFEWAVGDATITVYDEANNVVYQTVVDTNSTMEEHIPVVNWVSGEYMLTVQYGTITQRGNFQVE